MEEVQLNSPILLKEDGQLMEEGHSFSIAKDLSNLPKSFSKKELYCFYGPSFGMKIQIRDGKSELYFYDFKKKKEIQYLSFENGDSFSLDENKDGRKSLHGFYPQVDGKLLHFELNLEKGKEEPLYFASSYPDQKHLLYLESQLGLKLDGYLKFGDSLFNLKEENSFYRFETGVLPKKKKMSQLTGHCFHKGKRISFHFVSAPFVKGEINPNVVYYEDKIFKFGPGDFENSFSEKGEIDFNRNWHLAFLDGKGEIIGHPYFSSNEKKGCFFHSLSRHEAFCKLEGYLILDGEKIELEDALGLFEKED